MFLINTRRSRDKQIFTPLIGPLEIGDEIIICKILQKLLADALLHVLGGLQALFLERLDVGWNKYAANITFKLDSRLVDPPLCNKPIAVQSLL